MKIIFAILALLLLSATVFAFPEKHHQEQWCTEQGGQAEVMLADQIRADCITSTGETKRTKGPDLI